MQSFAGGLLTFVGVLWMAVAYFLMPILVGSDSREQTYNIGLMHIREVNLFVGGIFFLAGVFLLGTYQPVQASPLPERAESDVELADRLGISFDGESYVLNTQKFASLEAALLFAKRA
jgi:formate-dependent nitrite reductase membrane component NrfD